MKIVLVGARGQGRGHKCSHCRRAIASGQAALSQKKETGYKIVVELWWHRSCVEKLLASGPVDQSEYQDRFEELKAAALRGEEIL